MNNQLSLRQLGWQPFFQQQLSLSDLESGQLGRVFAQHRGVFIVQTETSEIALDITPSLPQITVGDWLLLDDSGACLSRLDRKSHFSRKAPGSQISEQSIAANVDTLFIVCSLNHDFNLSRIERYLALANEASVEPIIVLTKADLCQDAQVKKQQVQALDAMLVVELVNSLNSESVARLTPWCQLGKTVSFLGSSGVGKSTLINTLLAHQVQETGGIRENDSKGRHTTTARCLQLMEGGAVLIDTPGMRELQLAECEVGVTSTFSDVEQLVAQCRFSDCQHSTEPGCKIRNAISQGQLSQRRFENYQKLLSEQARNGESLKQKRDKGKALSKLYRTTQVEARLQKKGY